MYLIFILIVWQWKTIDKNNHKIAKKHCDIVLILGKFESRYFPMPSFENCIPPVYMMRTPYRKKNLIFKMSLNSWADITIYKLQVCTKSSVSGARIALAGFYFL